MDINAEKLVKVYIKIRDKRNELAKQDAELEEQLNVVQERLLDICKAAGTDILRTPVGTVTKRISKRYWTNDWESLYAFIKEHDAFHFLHQRLSTTNIDSFLAENPDLHPQGLNSDASYAVTVKRKPQ